MNYTKEISKTPSISLKEGIYIKTNQKPILELTTKIENITTDTNIKWEYNFTDEDKNPSEILFILNNIEYDNMSKIPTKLEGGSYSIKFKAQNSKGLWSNTVVKTFNVTNN